MNLNNVRDGELKQVFDDLEDAFDQLGIDFYLIGALARDAWYAKANKNFRTTKDADFAVLVASEEEFLKLKELLVQHKNFRPSKNNEYVLFSPNDIQIDILPFGSIEIDGEVSVQGRTSISVNGFMEVYNFGTEEMEVATGHKFKIATLPAIVLLKLIAFDDRPTERLKDATDIGNILYNYFHLETDLIYSDNHNDLFEQDEKTIDEISSIVIGREIKKIINTNEALLQRVTTILKTHIQEKENGMFVRQIGGETIEEIVKLLNRILEGILS